MMFDSVLRTEISVDNIIRKSENHAPWPTRKLDFFANGGIYQEVTFHFESTRVPLCLRERIGK